jgi:REP element-mobilizing transposase RayT
MARPIRHYKPNDMHLVTVRTHQGRSLLRPSAVTNALILGVLARAARKYGIKIYAYAFMSNHLHLLSGSGDGALSAFMRYLLTNISKKVGRAVGWRNSFFARRFSAEPVVDPAAQIDRFKYVLAHGVKEGRVRKLSEFPGVHCAHQVLSHEALVCHWFNWSRRRKRDGGDQDETVEALIEDALAEQETLTLSRLPAWDHLSDEEYRREVAKMIEEIEAEGRAKHRKVLGAESLKRAHPHALPRKLKRSPRPLCHAGTLESWMAYRAEYRGFRIAYAQASEAFRRGEWTVVFPPFSFRPSCAGRTAPVTAMRT